MLIYNVTIGIDPTVEGEWLAYMREVHIPGVMRTGMFVESKLYRILHDNDDGTISYSVQYFADGIDKVQQYLDAYAPALILEHQQKFKDKHVAFRTLLEEV